MNILYDYQVLLNKVSGASRSFCEIAHILKSEGNQIKFSFQYSDNLFLKEILCEYHPFLPQLDFKGKNQIRNLIEIWNSRKDIGRNDFDLLHTTGEKIYFEGLLKRPLVSTIHDMIPEYYLPNSPRLKNRKRIIQIADRIVCVSENTKQELLQYYSFANPDKIDVIYHGINPIKVPYIDNQWGDYILFVGVRKSYKNFKFALEALIPLFKKNKNLRMLCTGSPFTKEEEKFIFHYHLEKQIINVGFVDNNTLFSLYHHAQLFIFPSLYEGFGIPILEAFINQCPACISEASCFPEIAGDAAAYFNPKNKESILSAITKVLEDSEYKNTLLQKGEQRVKLFTWENSAHNMLNCYKKTLQ
jgi:glycosyltransferase involved in cell wall biosynthesis